MASPGTVLAIDDVSKTFPGQRALQGVSFDVRQGEVHALVGENGSGKSTLIKCLAGFHEPDEGSQITLNGRPLTHGGVGAERGSSQGMSFIHQELGLVPSLSVLENFALGRGFTTGRTGRIRWKVMAAEARALLTDFGHGEIGPDMPVSRLSQAQQTVVAIVRALQDAGEQGEGHVLVLDEPTAALPAVETERLFAALRRAVARGAAVIYVSHRLEEIFELANRVTVLRDGRKVGTYETADLDQGRLIELIVGQPIDAYYPSEEDTRRGDTVLDVHGLAGAGLRDISLTLREGEIVGVAGLLGSGRSELLRLIFGAERRTAGAVELAGRPIDPKSPADAIRRGIAMIPEDRREDAAFPEMSLEENVLVSDLPRYFRGGRLRKRDGRRRLVELMDEYRIRPPVPEKRFYQFSGGNQQKAIMARWLPLGPKLIMLDEPVQGVDVGAKAEIYAAIERAAAAGSAVLMVSSDFEDLAHVCHRVLVMRGRTIAGEMSGADLDRQRILGAVYSGERERNGNGRHGARV
jgi:ABC-type sugar transport system ATPase subunit